MDKKEVSSPPGRRKGPFPCGSRGEPWDLALTSAVPRRSEGLLMQIRAVFHMYDPEISSSRVNLEHESAIM